MRPTDPVVCITGATGALGTAAAAAFAADGARLGLVGTNGDRLTALAAELSLPDGRWAPGVGDLGNAAAAGAALAAVADRFGRIDVLLHLVGGWAGGTDVTDLDPAVLDDMLSQHLWSTFHATRAVVPGMRERGWGRIVAVTAAAASSPGPRMGAYAPAKAAQETLLRVLAREVVADGVTVNTIAVKAIDKERARNADPTGKHPSWTTPEEIVAAMRFLCSEAAAAVNGQRIALDGR